jgi:hypothetical protein
MLKLLVILVVFSTVLGTRQPVVAAAHAAPAATRTQWIERLTVGLSNPITRAALLRRIAFTPPSGARPALIVVAPDRPARPTLTRVEFPLPPPLV